MIKKHLKTVIITSILTLSPMIAGLILWNKLPLEIPVHFNISNEADGYASKAFAVLGLPLLMLAIHIVCVFSTKLDPKMKNLSDKVFTLVLYIVPATSVLMYGMIYSLALGKEVRVGLIINLFLGLLFTVTGNYLPKCKQSYTVGIKLPWTLEDAENWNKTHALAGKLWVSCGIIIILTAFLENPFIFFPVVAVMIIAPTAYSFFLFKRKNGEDK